jgi:hypothetical protein
MRCAGERVEEAVGRDAGEKRVVEGRKGGEKII